MSSIWEIRGMDEYLRKQVSAGTPYSQIAAELNDRFNIPVSRNAAIGRAGRLGLIHPRPSRPPSKRDPEKPKPRRHFKPKVKVEFKEEAGMRCVEVEPLHLSLMQLGPNECRWPYGEGPFTFCAHATLDGASYCDPHLQLSWGPGTESERSAERFLRKAAS